MSSSEVNNPIESSKEHNENQQQQQQQRRQRSCAPCAMAKRSCDHGRPYCGRCVSLEITEQCIILDDRRHHKGSTNMVVVEDGTVISTKRTSEYATYKIKTLFNESSASSSSSSSTHSSSSIPISLPLDNYPTVGSTSLIVPPENDNNKSGGPITGRPIVKRYRFNPHHRITTTTTTSTTPTTTTILTRNEEDNDEDYSEQSRPFHDESFSSSTGHSSPSDTTVSKLNRILDYFAKPSAPSSVITSRQLYYRMHHFTSKLCNVINMLPVWPHENYLKQVKEVQQLLQSFKHTDEETNVPALSPSLSASSRTTVPSLPLATNVSSKYSASPNISHDDQSLSSPTVVPPVPDNDPFEISNRLTIALLPNPMMRVIFEEPDLRTVVPGTPLKVQQMYYNYRWAEVTGAPSPLPGRLAFVLTPENIVTHVHADDRHAYLNNIASIVLLRAVRGTFRGRYKFHNGWTYADEISDVTYFPSGCGRSINISYTNIDAQPVIPFPSEVLQMREAIAKNPSSMVVQYTVEGDLLFRPDFLKAIQLQSSQSQINLNADTPTSASNDDVVKYYQLLQTMLQKFTLNDNNNNDDDDDDDDDDNNNTTGSSSSSNRKSDVPTEGKNKRSSVHQESKFSNDVSRRRLNHSLSSSSASLPPGLPIEELVFPKRNHPGNYPISSSNPSSLSFLMNTMGNPDHRDIAPDYLDFYRGNQSSEWKEGIASILSSELTDAFDLETMGGKDDGRNNHRSVDHPSIDFPSPSRDFSTSISSSFFGYPASTDNSTTEVFNPFANNSLPLTDSSAVVPTERFLSSSSSLSPNGSSLLAPPLSFLDHSAAIEHV